MINYFIFGALTTGTAALLLRFPHVLQAWQLRRTRARRATAEIIAATQWDSRYRTARQIPRFFATLPKGIRYSSPIGMEHAKSGKS